MGVVPGKISLVGGNELLGGRAGASLESVKLAGLGRGDNQRAILGPDDVVGRDDPGASVAGELGSIHESEDRIAAAEIHNEPPIGTRPLRVGQTASPSENGRNV